MQRIAFIDTNGVVLANGQAKTLTLPEFDHQFDNDMVIGVEYTKPVPRMINVGEVTMTLKDYKINKALTRFIERAFNRREIVTLMVLTVDQVSPTVATSDSEFYSGYISRPSRTVSPDKADDGSLKIRVTDAWRTENGFEVWRLPTGSSDMIGVEMVYS
jgi:hypothetical protein